MNDAIMAPGRRPGLSRRAGRAGMRGAALLLGMAAALAAAPALAMQVLDAVDHAELRAEVSANSVSRIALHDDRIARVIRSPGGFETEHDPGSGDLYLRPLGGDLATGPETGVSGDGGEGDAEPVALFIGTEKGFTYRLTLTRAMRGSAQILIRNAAASNPVRDGMGADGWAAGEARIGALVRLIGAVARREPLPGYAIEAPGDVGNAGVGVAGTRVPTGALLRTVEIWRGPRFEARVVEILDRTPGGPGDERIADAAGIAAWLGPGSAAGPGIAAAWLAGSGTGPSGGRIAVTVHERASALRTGASR